MGEPPGEGEEEEEDRGSSGGEGPVKAPAYYNYLTDLVDPVDVFDEWVEYSLGPRNETRRCSMVGVRIPSLPQGPLSVRSFHLQTPDREGRYHRVTDDYITLDVEQMQRFAVVPPIETARLRVVCTTNAAQIGFRCVGFFDVEFA